MKLLYQGIHEHDGFTWEVRLVQDDDGRIRLFEEIYAGLIQTGTSDALKRILKD